MRRIVAVTITLTIAACATLPPAPATRPDTEVNASFGKTWDAVIDYFARGSIPIKTIDRASGIVAAEAQRLPGDNSAYAVCVQGVMGHANVEGASFNALIHGDSTHSTVRVTANWIPSAISQLNIHCQTTDVWEKQFESAIKAKAEAP